MPEHQYRWSIEFALLKIVFSFIGWTGIFCVPGVMLWMWSLNKPGREMQVLAGIGGLIFVCGMLHSLRFWPRLFDRSPQLELYPGFLRARQLGDEDILWEQVVLLRGSELLVSRDSSILVVVTTDGEIELDLTGFDASMQQILEDASALCRRRRQGGSAAASVSGGVEPAASVEIDRGAEQNQ